MTRGGTSGHRKGIPGGLGFSVIDDSVKLCEQISSQNFCA
jgi:hypothetical protein